VGVSLGDNDLCVVGNNEGEEVGDNEIVSLGIAVGDNDIVSDGDTECISLGSSLIDGEEDGDNEIA